MADTFDAVVEETIAAPATAVWHALTTPELVAKYFHGTQLDTEWRVGGPIVWRGEWQGKSYEDKGTVLAFEPPSLLRNTHWSPMSGTADSPENYHEVTYTLTERDGTTTVQVRQSNIPTQEAADKMARDGWTPIMRGLKELVEAP
jgi:uncharacterized protein YndB with AHSA1/START domain